MIRKLVILLVLIILKPVEIILGFIGKIYRRCMMSEVERLIEEGEMIIKEEGPPLKRKR